MALTTQTRPKVCGDSISERFRRNRREAETLARSIFSGKLTKARTLKAEKRIEAISLESNLLWRVRKRMMEISPLR